MKRTLAAAVLLAAATLLLLRLLPHRHGGARVAADDDDEAPVAASSRVAMRDGVAVITLDAQTQAANGMRVAPLAAAAAPPQAEAPAEVLDIAPLVTARAQIVAALATLAKAQAAVDVAQQEDQRLQRLYQQQQNASAKQVEAATAALHAGQADLSAAQQAISLEAAAVRAQWGDTIASWIEHGAPPLADLLARRSLLVQVTLPAGEGAPPGGNPARVAIQTPAARVPATLVSAYPQADPRLQGLSLLYLAPARPGLATGLNLTAWLPQGPPARGVLIPDAAILWWQGAPWIYERTSPTTFVRRAVPADHPLPGGLFAASGFKRGEAVVVAGASALLAEELRAQIQTED